MAISLTEFHLATAESRQRMHQHGLLAQGMMCPKCNTVMQENTFNGVSDVKRWRWPPINCSKPSVSNVAASLRSLGSCRQSLPTSYTTGPLSCLYRRQPKNYRLMRTPWSADTTSFILDWWWGQLNRHSWSLFSWPHHQSSPARWTRPHRRRQRDHGHTSETWKCARSSRPLMIVDVRQRRPQHWRFLYGNRPQTRHHKCCHKGPQAVLSLQQDNVSIFVCPSLKSRRICF